MSIVPRSNFQAVRTARTGRYSVYFLLSRNALSALKTWNIWGSVQFWTSLVKTHYIMLSCPPPHRLYLSVSLSMCVCVFSLQNRCLVCKNWFPVCSAVTHYLVTCPISTLRTPPGLATVFSVFAISLSPVISGFCISTLHSICRNCLHPLSPTQSSVLLAFHHHLNLPSTSAVETVRNIKHVRETHHTMTTEKTKTVTTPF